MALAFIRRGMSGPRAIILTAGMLRRPTGSASLATMAKYLVRALATWPTATHWARTILANACLRRLARCEPHLLFRMQRPYLRAGLPPETALRWLREHFAWLSRNWSPAQIRAWQGEGPLHVARLGAGPLERYAIELRLAGARYCKEGELALALTLDDEPLMTAVFTVHGHGAITVLDIGCVQGAPGSSESIRQATRDLSGLRPKQAVLLAVRAFAVHYGIDAIVGVPNDAHVSLARRRTRGRVNMDYDRFWQEMGGVRLGNDYWLTAMPSRRSLADIDSRKRAQYRRRYALEDALWGAVSRGLQDCSAAVSAPIAELPTSDTPARQSPQSAAASRP